MSVIGFDIGNESCVIAAAKRGGIDVLLNDESKRETPSVVCFGEKQRFLGSAGAASATAYPRSTISQVKRLVGREYKDLSVQEDLKLLPFVTCEGPRGGILIEIDYMKEKMKFTPVEILGMLFKHLKQTAEKNLESDVVDCVIGIPSYFTDLQRRDYLDAASIAGLNPLRLMHDCTATALGYGMYKTDFLEGKPAYVIFVDIGHCDTQVTVAGFVEGKMKIFSHSFDQNLGGRDFDEVLFKYFAAQFKEKHDIDVYSHPRASIRLRAACEKVKKVLSANAEAPLSIDCLIGDTDVRGMITREKFEELSSELLERVTVPCRKAIEDSRLSVDKISTIELVGSGSRIPAIMRILASLFHREPTRTLNASECVARGCALRCAMLSPTQKVRDYMIGDFFPYAIGLKSNEPEFEGFSKGSPFPCYTMISSKGNNSLYIKVFYSNKTDVPPGLSPIVGQFFIEPSRIHASEAADIDFKLKLNHHGIVEIESASLVDDRPHKLLGYFSYPDRVVVDNLVVSENLDVATTKNELLEAQERELRLAEQDKKVEQTKDQRNSLESFVYDTRNKLSSTYRSFVTDLQKEEITTRLQETEEWLYEDSDDECEDVYTGKLEDLKKLVDPIEMRYNSDKEEKARAVVTQAMETCIEKYRSGANSMAPSRSKAELFKQCNEAEKWLNRVPQPSIRQIKNAIETFEGYCKEIIRSKPSFPQHDKPMHMDQRNRRDQPVDSDQQDQPKESDRRGRPILSNQRNQPVDSNQKNRLMDLIQREGPINSDQRDQAVESDQRDQHKESDPKGQPLKSGQGEQSLDLSQSDQPVNSNESDQPEDQRDLPVDSNQKDHPVDSNPRSKPADSNHRNKLVDSKQRSKLKDSNQGNKPVDSKQRSKLEDSNQMNKPVDLNKHVVSNQKNKPVVSNQRNKPTLSNQVEQALDISQKNKPVVSNQRNKPTLSNQMEQDLHINQRNKPVDSNQRNKHVDSNERNKPVISNQIDQTAGMEQLVDTQLD